MYFDGTIRFDPVEYIPHHVDVWYCRAVRSWCIQLKTVDDYQIGDSIYVHTKREAMDEKAYIMLTYGLTK